MISFTFLVISTVLQCGIGAHLPGLKNGLDAKVVGGKPITDIQTRPYHAALEFNGLDLQICSAAVISDTWAVTSAHCVALLLPIDLQLRVGTVRNAFDGDVYKITEVAQHPLFEQVWYTSVDYDVGLVKTSSEIAFSASVQPIALPERDAQLPDGTEVTVSGWGVISSTEGAQPPRTLQLASLQIRSSSSCNITTEFHGNVTERMLCAGSETQDACFGDNGGPLVAGNTTYGVVSWGIGCGVVEFLSVFTNLANFEIRDFITEHSGL